MDDAVLVADAGHMQDVTNVVNNLEQAGVSQANKHSRDYRPWGWFGSQRAGISGETVACISKGALSLQNHQHRSEHWVVVSGTASVVREGEVFTLEANESVYIHMGQRHRLANETEEPLTVIEVQTGRYLGEDDIIRYEDLYLRE